MRRRSRSVSRPEQLYAFAEQRADLQGDEETAEYSDNEADPDDDRIKTDRKQTVSLLKGAGSRMAIIAQQRLREGLHNDAIQLGPPQIASDGLFHEVTGIDDYSRAMEIAKAIDPALHTRLVVTTGMKFDASVFAVTYPVTARFCYDGLSMVEDHLNARWWPCDAFLGTFLLALGLFLLYIAWRKLSIYL